MKAKSEIQNPDDIHVTLTLTASLAEWKVLRKNLPAAWPAWELAQAIDGLVSSTHRVVEINLTKEG